VAGVGKSYLSRVDLLAGEGIVVGTHTDCCVDIRRLELVVDSMATQIVLWVEVVVVDLVTKIEKSRKCKCGRR
jgi:hypothetical protein